MDGMNGAVAEVQDRKVYCIRSIAELGENCKVGPNGVLNIESALLKDLIVSNSEP